MTDQGFTFDEALPAHDYDNVVSIDIDRGGLRVDHSRTITFLGIGLPQTFSEIVAGDLGHVDGIESLFGVPTGDMLSSRRAATVRQQQQQLEALADPSRATINTSLTARDRSGSPACSSTSRRTIGASGGSSSTRARSDSRPSGSTRSPERPWARRWSSSCTIAW